MTIFEIQTLPHTFILLKFNTACSGIYSESLDDMPLTLVLNNIILTYLRLEEYLSLSLMVASKLWMNLEAVIEIYSGKSTWLPNKISVEYVHKK